MMVEWALASSFGDVRRIDGPHVSRESDFTGKVRLDQLPAASRIHYRVRFDGERASEVVSGSFTTAPRHDDARDVLMAWSGDVNGQGWGIEEKLGMPAVSALAARRPDLYVSCGDSIYADDPIVREVRLPDGRTYRNVVTEAKGHVAQTLDDFRGAHLYARHAREVRDFAGTTPTFAIWDDHEVRNNWFPGQTLTGDPRYRETNIDTLAAFARRAMLEHAPEVRAADAPMYRSVRWGARLELFLLDGRGHRTKNWPAPPEEAFFGPAQMAWLASALTASTATWKVIACNMPLGLVIDEREPDGSVGFDGVGNGNGLPKGREVELARLFSTLARAGTKNLVFVTADVHFAAAHRFDAEKAQHKEMPTFHEFIAGPLHASAFGRKALDDTFGVEVLYVNAEWDTFGTPADPKTQTFGTIAIDGRSGTMTVSLVDGTGHDLHTTVLRPS